MAKKKDKRKTTKILGKGKYCFRDVGTGKTKCVKASHPTIAAKKVSKTLTNWEFISFKKIRKTREK